METEELWRKFQQGGGTFQFPHCDALILHAPSECEYCDRHPDWQALRMMWAINFTGHYDHGKALCPAEEQRGLGKIERWGGNVPTRGRMPSPEQVEAAMVNLQDLYQELQNEAGR